MPLAFDRFIKITQNLPEAGVSAGDLLSAALLGSDNAVAAATTSGPNIKKNGGAAFAQRGNYNLIEGANITLTIVDNAGTDSTDITITGAAGGGGGYFTDGTGTNAAVGKGTVPPIAGGENAFSHGDASDGKALNSFAHGDTVVAGKESTGAHDAFWGSGNNINMGGIGGYYGVTANTSMFAQGKNIIIDSYGYQSYNMLAQGSDLVVGSFFENGELLVQGRGLTIDGENNLCQGRNFSVNGAYIFAQGRDHLNVGGSAITVQGFSHDIGSIGSTATFGRAGLPSPGFSAGGMCLSNSLVSARGGAQIQSFVVGQQSTDANVAPIEIVSFRDFSRSMLINIYVTMRKVGVDNEMVTFESLGVLVYRNAAGNAVIEGSPTFTQTNSVGTIGASTVVFDVPFSKVIRLTVTGTGTGTFRWTVRTDTVDVRDQ